MFKKSHLLLSFAAVLLVTVTVNSAEKKEAKFSAKCPISGKAALETSAVDYKGGKVYFCCNNCPKAFAKDTKKYAVKANMQLVSTKQAKQVKCPMSGRPVNANQTVTINKIEVGLCCGNCKKTASGATGDAQLELVFSDAAFKKGFEVAKKKTK